MNAGRIAWSILGLVSLCVTVRAGPVTWHFAGEITRVGDTLGLLGGGVDVGTPFFGSYTFESTTPDSDPHPRRGTYNDSLITLSGQVGLIPFDQEVDQNSLIKVENDFGSSTLDIYLVQARAMFADELFDIGLQLLDDTGTIFASDTLSLFPPDITRFDIAEFAIFDSNEQIPINVSGTVRILVPDVGSLTLLLLGVVCCVTGWPISFGRLRMKDVHATKKSGRNQGEIRGHH